MKKIIVILLGMFLICSCASGKLWYKDGATQTSFARDKMECQYEAELATAGHSGTGISGGLAVGFRQLDLIKKCMRLKGYELR